MGVLCTTNDTYQDEGKYTLLNANREGISKYIINIFLLLYSLFRIYFEFIIVSFDRFCEHKVVHYILHFLRKFPVQNIVACYSSNF